MNPTLQNLNLISKKIILYCLIIFPFVALPLQAQEINLTVTGVGNTKADAIIDAQRNALRTSYGEIVSTNLTTLNNELTKNETVNLVFGTIKDFKILSESVNDFSVPPITEVLMQITVNKGQLVSFAKAIGDSVEIQGSIYGAELRLQEINKKNEAVAMKHLEKKAEIISSLFDYKIKVKDPKMSPILEDDFFIYSSVTLETNQNFANLMDAITKTIEEIAVKPSEKINYIKLNVPLYKLDILKIIEPKCADLLTPESIDSGDSTPSFSLSDEEGLRYPRSFPGKLSYKKFIVERDLKQMNIVEFPKPKSRWGSTPWPKPKKKGIEVLYENFTNHSVNYGWGKQQGYKIECTLAEIDRIFLRSKDSYQSIERINALIKKNINSYHVYRKIRGGEKLIYPNIFNNKNMNWWREAYLQDYSTILSSRLVSYDRDGYLSDLSLKNMVKKSIPNDNLFTVNNIGRRDSKNVCARGLCYKDTNFPPHAYDVQRLKLLPVLGWEVNEGFIFDSRRWVYPKLSEEFVKSYKTMREFTYNSGMHSIQVGSSGQILQIYPINSFFAVLHYEDIVKRNELSKITGYSVEQDK